MESPGWDIAGVTDLEQRGGKIAEYTHGFFAQRYNNTDEQTDKVSECQFDLELSSVPRSFKQLKQMQ